MIAKLMRPLAINININEYLCSSSLKPFGQKNVSLCLPYICLFSFKNPFRLIKNKQKILKEVFFDLKKTNGAIWIDV